jgi:hypothetical protein
MDIVNSIATPQSSPSITQRKRKSSCATTTDESQSAPTEPAPTFIRRSQTVYSPLVSSMVESNTLRDCHQIKSMVLQCQRESVNYNGTSSEPFVCRTAKKYYAMCLSGERL